VVAVIPHHSVYIGISAVCKGSLGAWINQITKYYILKVSSFYEMLGRHFSSSPRMALPTSERPKPSWRLSLQKRQLVVCSQIDTIW
ncbi:hypothetical protein CSUI_008985, partial [Cystoisospora suis]